LPWWEFPNTKRDSREQFEEQSYLLFQKKKKVKTHVSKQGRQRDLKSAPFQTSIAKISLVDTQKVHRFRRNLE
jgi:hypothetical protein